jgi:transglutaminase-like putative cysteine protease
VAARDRRLELDLAATMGLALYSLFAALGFARVFGDWAFVADVATVVIVGHGLSFMLRRLDVPAVAAVALVAAAMAWTVGWLYYPSTFAAIFPTMDTWNVAWADLSLVRAQFRDAVAPVAYVGGWGLLAGIGTGFVVLAGDTFAFRAHARGEALVPGAVLFVFVAALGADRHRIGLTLGLVAAGFLAAALLRVRFAPTPRTVLGRTRSPLSLTLPAAAAAGTAVVLGAWVIGPQLPGAGADALVDTSSRGGGVTEVLSPLVDIRSRLVRRATTEMFVVDSTAPAYWRATALPEFDGNTWGLPDRSIEEVGGATLSEAAPGSSENRQVIVISALEGALVPAAAEPVAASGEGLRWNDETATLVRVDRPLERGDRFEVVSAMPTFSADVLRSSTSVSPPDPIYTELPEDFPTSIGNAAESVTAEAPSTYDAMLRLQNWFQQEFQYNVEVPEGHGNSAIEAFLRQRIGYCEQFAGTFAAMARSLGVPARVAVGFTPGLAQEDGTRSVLGKNAHAWPEVWFDEVGWVPFEPTPGRGAPGSEDHTGLAPAQDDTPPQPSTEAPVEAGAAPPIEDPPLPEAAPPIEDPDAALPAGPPRFMHAIPEPGTSWGAVLGGMALMGGLLLLPEVVRRWRRHHPPADPGREVIDLWQRALGAVEATGCRVDPTLTALEQARAVSPRLPVAARPLKSLAGVATAAAFAPVDEVEQLARPLSSGEPGPRRWCRQVERVAADSMTAGGRFRRYFTVWK